MIVQECALATFQLMGDVTSHLSWFFFPLWCSSAISVKFPRFHGYSHMTFEPLKNSYQTFQITLEFKVSHQVWCFPPVFFSFRQWFKWISDTFSLVQADSEDGLLLYCGENEHGRGDFTSLALVRGKLHYRWGMAHRVCHLWVQVFQNARFLDFCLCRFNCGTGAAQIVSESSIALGQWHTVTVFRDGMSGWLRMDNDTPISGRSQVTAYTCYTLC